MIGGYDIQEIGHVSGEDVDLFLRSVRTQWPDGVVETADGTSTMSIREGLRIHWNPPCEFFLYESRASYEAWTRDGFTEEYSASMVSVSVEPDCIAFVVNMPDSRSHNLVVQSIDAIRRNRRAFMKAA